MLHFFYAFPTKNHLIYNEHSLPSWLFPICLVIWGGWSITLHQRKARDFISFIYQNPSKSPEVIHSPCKYKKQWFNPIAFKVSLKLYFFLKPGSKTTKSRRRGWVHVIFYYFACTEKPTISEIRKKIGVVFFPNFIYVFFWLKVMTLLVFELAFCLLFLVGRRKNK